MRVSHHPITRLLILKKKKWEAGWNRGREETEEMPCEDGREPAMLHDDALGHQKSKGRYGTEFPEGTSPVDLGL